MLLVGSLVKLGERPPFFQVEAKSRKDMDTHVESGLVVLLIDTNVRMACTRLLRI